MEKTPPPWYFFALFPLYFVGLWCAISLLISRIGGWRRLAQHFPARSQPSGKRYSMLRAKVGWASYKNCLTVYSSPEGFFISVWALFRLGHPPLFIPRAEIHNPTARRFLWMETVTFDIGSPRITTMQLPKKVFGDLGVATLQK
jgi:hypothetical protein